MSVAAILFDRPGAGDPEALDRFLETTLAKVRRFTDDIHLFTAGRANTFGLKTCHFTKTREFLEFLSRNFSKRTVMLLSAYAPLMDEASAREMIEDHQAHVFDFTFPENLPEGLMPELLEGEVAEFIRHTVPEEMPMFPGSVREVFERDISSYDCNLFVSESDLSKFRVNFLPDTYNDFLVTRDILDHHGSGFTIESLGDLVRSRPSLIRKRPTYFELELTTDRESGVFFAGSRLTRSGRMSPDTLRKTLKQASEFSRDPWVSLGLYGEPFTHPEFPGVLGVLREFPKMKFLFESRCLWTDPRPLESALELPNAKILLDVSFANPDAFAQGKKPADPLLPFEGLRALEEKIRKLPRSENLYIQLTRSTENENELAAFYERWRDFVPPDRLVIRKIDTFGGELDALRVVDLSPVKRWPCHHLKHDLVVFHDGTVPLCRQDLNGKFPAGNVLKDGLEKCWERLAAHYERQWAGDYSDPPLCRGCDEWWVFNF